MYAMALSLSILIVGWQQDTGTKIAQAGTEHNVSGYAWSENFGWVSFNCTNEASCGSVNYGVSVNPGTGDFSGYAWSSNLGWIDFGPTSGFPEAPNNGARYDSATGAVSGWAKILSLGDDGWLKMSGTWANGVKINDSSGDFSGWAWNGNAVSGIGLGWLSFNCLNDSSCAGSNYKVNAVINQAPEARNLTAFHWNYLQASQYGALKAFVKWQFFDADSGDTESAYQIIVDDDADPASPLIDTGKCIGYQNPLISCLIEVGVDSYPVHNQISLNYNQKYYWWVKIWDNHNAASALNQYNSAADTDNDDGDPLTFTTYRHEFPSVDFNWFPTAPSQSEEVQFSDASKYYPGAAPATPTNCDDANCDWRWTVPADAVIDDANIANPKITFGSSGEMSVTLKVTDSDGYFSSLTKILDLKQKLPTWKEVKPE